jgi:hypothetical protein
MKGLISIIPILFLILALCTAGCQTSTIISTLENVVSAAEIAIPVIGAATGLSSATSALIVSYLQEVNIATAQAATILAGTGTSAQKAAQIAQAFAAIAAGCNCVPPGTPQEVVAVVNAVAQAVLQFLTNFPSTPATPPVVKVTAANRTALALIRTRSEKNAANLKGVKK